MSPLTTQGRKVAALSDEVLARVAALRPTATYRVLRRCPVWSKPSRAADILGYVDADDLVLGHRTGTWVETGRGYVHGGNLRKVEP